MAVSFGYSEWRARLRTSLNHRERILGWFRILRYALVQGPWRPWFVRHYVATSPNPPLKTCPVTLFRGLDVDGAARSLERDAYANGLVVPGDIVDDIVAWTREVGAKRIDDPHADCSGVQRIAHDPRVVEVARRYLGAEPILFSSKIYWTLPPSDAQGRLNAAAERGQFHYDLADVKAITVFVYLTDVDEQSGPHVVVRGTQERRTLAQILRRTIDDATVEQRYRDRVQVVLGPRGTTWFEDITCYHKQQAGSKVRLMLSFIYSLHRQPLAEDENRPKASSDSRPSDRRRAAAGAGAPTAA